jgi:hypothetical protein
MVVVMLTDTQRLERAIELIEKERSKTLDAMKTVEGLTSYLHGIDYCYGLIVTAVKSHDSMP